MIDRDAIQRDARAAKEIVESPIWNKAVTALRNQWIAQLIIVRTDEEERRICSQIRALNSVGRKLEVFAASAKFQKVMDAKHGR